MNFIQLSRACDNYARQDGYDNFPDDLLSLILDYDGCNNNKPHNHHWAISITYDKNIAFYDKEVNHYIYKTKTKNITIYYCEVCNSFYSNKISTNHDNTKKHKHNKKYYYPEHKNFKVKNINRSANEWLRIVYFPSQGSFTGICNYRDHKWIDMGLMTK
jgi:hypothetical protein